MPDRIGSTSSIGHKSRVMTAASLAIVATNVDAPRLPDCPRGAIEQATHAVGRPLGQHCSAVVAVSGLGRDEFCGAMFGTRIRDCAWWQLSFVAELIAAPLLSSGDGGRSRVLRAKASTTTSIAGGRRFASWSSLMQDPSNVSAASDARVDRRLLRTFPGLRAVRAHNHHRGGPEIGLVASLLVAWLPRVVVEDQGRVTIEVGSRTIEGSRSAKECSGSSVSSLRDRFSAARDRSP